MRLATLIATCLLVSPAICLADTPPDVVALSKTPQVLLEALDKRHNHYPTQKWTFEMVIKPPSGAKRSVKFAVQQKGSKRLVRFLEPGSVKGMSVLSKGTKMYVFSPQTENVRLVATSARRQTLLGSDLSFSDMATVDLAPAYAASVISSKDNRLWLELARKEGSDAAWPKLRLGVNKKHALIEVIEYWDSGKKIKEQTRTDFGLVSNIPTWKTITMTDVASGHKTTLNMLKQAIGEEIPDKVFTKRSLVRGR